MLLKTIQESLEFERKKACREATDARLIAEKTEQLALKFDSLLSNALQHQQEVWDTLEHDLKEALKKIFQGYMSSCEYDIALADIMEAVRRRRKEAGANK